MSLLTSLHAGSFQELATFSTSSLQRSIHAVFNASVSTHQSLTHQLSTYISLRSYSFTQMKRKHRFSSMLVFTQLNRTVFKAVAVAEIWIQSPTNSQWWLLKSLLNWLHYPIFHSNPNTLSWNRSSGIVMHTARQRRREVSRSTHNVNVDVCSSLRAVKPQHQYARGGGWLIQLKRLGLGIRQTYER